MKRALLLLLFLAALLPAKKHERAWQKGTLIDSQTTTTQGSSVAVAQNGAGSYAGTAAQAAGAAMGAAAAMPYSFRLYQIRSGDYVYTVRLLEKRHMPDVTVNGPIRYASEKAKFYLLDDNGQEFRVSLVEKRLSK